MANTAFADLAFHQVLYDAELFNKHVDSFDRER